MTRMLNFEIKFSKGYFNQTTPFVLLAIEYVLWIERTMENV